MALNGFILIELQVIYYTSPHLFLLIGERLWRHPAVQLPQVEAGREHGHQRHQVELHQVRNWTRAADRWCRHQENKIQQNLFYFEASRTAQLLDPFRKKKKKNVCILV